VRHAGSDHLGGDAAVFRRLLAVRPGLREALGGFVDIEYAVGLVLSVALLAYLAYALLKPERF